MAEDTYGLARFKQALALYDSGKFIVAREKPYNGFLGNEKVGILAGRHYDPNNSYKFYDGKTSWGFFNYNYDARVWVLEKGDVPEKYQGENKPKRPHAATAVIYPRHTLINIGDGVRVVDADIDVPPQVRYGPTNYINEQLNKDELPIFVWKAEFDPSWETAQNEKGDTLRVFNDSIQAIASAAICDENRMQLVALQYMPNDAQIAKAIRATLANNNSKEFITISGAGERYTLRGAKKGFPAAVVNTKSKTTQGASVGVVVLVNPLTGDPQLWTEDYFYVIATPNQDLEAEFVTRLNLALPWPVQPEWANYLLAEGRSGDLVQDLAIIGDEFAKAVAVHKNDEGWREIIAKGLEGEYIRFQTIEQVDNHG